MVEAGDAAAERKELLQARQRVLRARKEAERTLTLMMKAKEAAAQEERHAAAAARRSEKACRAEEERLSQHVPAIIIELAKRRLQEVERERGNLKMLPCEAERAARDYALRQQEKGKTPLTEAGRLRHYSQQHLRQLLTPRGRNDPKGDAAAAAATGYDRFLRQSLRPDAAPFHWHLHLGAGGGGTERGLRAAESLSSVEVPRQPAVARR